MRRVCCVSIDVDPVSCYYEIHSLGEAPRHLRSTILCASLPRYAALFAERGIRATFFVVARDVEVATLGADAVAMRAALRSVQAAGHEIASHSYSHPYDLARWSAEDAREEIDRAHTLLSELVGEEIVGFRAPGYDLSAAMLAALEDKGYLYDSSVFPAPGYYLAKALVMGGLRLIGRKSGAVLTNPRALAAPIEPYQPDLGSPFRLGDAQIVELPIAVTKASRTPVIGTNLMVAPAWLRDHWLASMARRDFFNFELHGIDLCDAAMDDLPPALVSRQPDLRVALDRKLATLAAVLDSIAASGAEFSTLADYARER